MTAEPGGPAVDVRLEWKEGPPAAIRSEVDRVDVEAPATAGQVVLVEGEGPADAVEPAPPQVDNAPSLDAGAVADVETAEAFEWSADRERAIEEALRVAPEGALARVHGQLEAVRAALDASRLDPDRAGLLIDEVERYLAARLAEEETRVPVAHAAIVQARADRRRAFAAWQEAAGALREYLVGGDRVQLEVAAYAADQGAGYLAAARRAVFDAQPERP